MSLQLLHINRHYQVESMCAPSLPLCTHLHPHQVADSVPQFHSYSQDKSTGTSGVRVPIVPPSASPLSSIVDTTVLFRFTRYDGSYSRSVRPPRLQDCGYLELC